MTDDAGPDWPTPKEVIRVVSAGGFITLMLGALLSIWAALGTLTFANTGVPPALATQLTAVGMAVTVAGFSAHELYEWYQTPDPEEVMEA